MQCRCYAINAGDLEKMRGRVNGWNDNIRSYFGDKVLLDIYGKGSRYARFIEDFGIASKQGRVLDVGCSSGGFSRDLQKMGFDVVGVDISLKAIETARLSSPGIEFHNQDISSWKHDKKFDFIFCMFDLLSFIPTKQRRLKALENMYSMLKRKGILYLTFIRPTWKTYIKAMLHKFRHPLSEFMDTFDYNYKTGTRVRKHQMSKGEIISYSRALGLAVDLADKGESFVVVIKR